MSSAPQAPRRALVLSNPKAGGTSVTPDGAVEVLRSSGMAVAVEGFAGPDEVSAAIIRRKADTDLVVVAGGDGTINCAVPGLIATGLPFGILPTGTANDLARTLSIPSNLEDAARVIAQGHTRRIDAGTVNDIYFLNVASVGLAVDLARRLTVDSKRRWGRLAYALAAARALIAARPFSAVIAAEGKDIRVRTLQIAVGNGRHYGGGSVVEETAAIDDRRLDLYSLELSSVWKLALLALAFRRGTHGLWKEVRTERNVAFEIRTRRPRPVNADGDLVTFTPARFAVHPAALTVFTPPD